MIPAIATSVTTFPWITWATRQRLGNNIQVKMTQLWSHWFRYKNIWIKHLSVSARVSAPRLCWGRDCSTSAEILSSCSQPKHQHQPVEHPQEQHWQRPLQSEDARAAERAAQHPAEDVRGAGVLWAAGQGCRHARPFPAYGKAASCSDGDP